MLPEVPQPGEKFRILIVEDDISIGRLLTANLTKAGFLCRHAPDGGLGLAAFHEFNPHLVLLDLMMPVMDGRQVCAKIRESSTVPIIMLSAMDKEEDQMQGLKLGADDYVTKPFNPKLLVTRVMTHLRRAYRYSDAADDVAAGGSASTSTRKIPLGWGMCEACGYMGPQSRFESDAGAGRRILQCPVCKQENRVTFPLG
jgi:two-component system, OmpR family, response regulator RpaB